MRELIANEDFTMPTSYVSHSKPSISKVKGVRFRLDDVRSIDAVWHFLDKVILKILYIDSTLTGYTSSQQGSSTEKHIEALREIVKQSTLRLGITGLSPLSTILCGDSGYGSTA